MSFDGHIFIFPLGMYIKIESLNHFVCSALVDIAKPISNVITPVYRVSVAPYLHQHLVLCIFHFSHSGDNVALSHGSFNLHSPRLIKLHTV